MLDDALCWLFVLGQKRRISCHDLQGIRQVGGTLVNYVEANKSGNLLGDFSNLKTQ